MRFLRRWTERWLGRSTDLGSRGERLAAQHLQSLGYRILERNLRIGDDEADLIALDPDGRTVAIVEVKSRSDDGIAPEHAINSRKQRHVARLAAALHKRKPYQDALFRFDAVAVIIPADGSPIVRHIPGAFQIR